MGGGGGGQQLNRRAQTIYVKQLCQIVQFGGNFFVFSFLNTSILYNLVIFR